MNEELIEELKFNQEVAEKRGITYICLGIVLFLLTIMNINFGFIGTAIPLGILTSVVMTASMVYRNQVKTIKMFFKAFNVK